MIQGRNLVRGGTWVVFALAIACKQPPSPLMSIPVDGGCQLESWAADVVELGQRAARGESVVAEGGCSVFDGKLLARGFPQDSAQAQRMMEVGPGCTPVLNAVGRRIRMERVQGRLMVVELRMVGSPDESAQDGATPSPLIKAARCPELKHRLQDEDDAVWVEAYAVATRALRSALEAASGSGVGPGKDARQALAQACAVSNPGSDGGTDRPGEPEPLAAMALLMASSFTVFEGAAQQMKVEDEGLNAVHPAAAAVLKDAPRTNQQGVCAMRSMAEAVMAHVEAKKDKQVR